MSHPSPLTIAPAFELKDTDGTPHSLDEYVQHGPVLLVFHRGTW